MSITPIKTTGFDTAAIYLDQVADTVSLGLTTLVQKVLFRPSESDQKRSGFSLYFAHKMNRISFGDALLRLIGCSGYNVIAFIDGIAKRCFGKKPSSSFENETDSLKKVRMILNQIISTPEFSQTKEHVEAFVDAAMQCDDLSNMDECKRYLRWDLAQHLDHYLSAQITRESEQQKEKDAETRVQNANRAVDEQLDTIRKQYMTPISPWEERLSRTRAFAELYGIEVPTPEDGTLARDVAADPRHNPGAEAPALSRPMDPRFEALMEASIKDIFSRSGPPQRRK